MSTVESAGRLDLYPLAIRQDRGEWIVGRVATGVFVALPDVGMDVLRRLIAGESVSELSDEVPELDIDSFVETLQSLGFVRSRDGHGCPDAHVMKPTLPRLRPSHLRWLRSPLWVAYTLGMLLVANAWIWTHSAARPTVDDLAHATSSGTALVILTAISWPLTLAHEFGHLAVARAYDVPARIRLGTRLQFLVVQTDISGIMSQPLRVRLYAYAAGPLVTGIAATGLAAAMTASPRHSLVHAISATLFVGEVASLCWELLVFMRTDGYFMMRDLSGCRDLYGDGWAYIRSFRSAVLHPRTHRSPLAGLPPKERPWIRLFAVVLVVGSVGCLTFGATVSIPAGLSALSQVYNGLVDPSTGSRFVDSALAAVIGLCGLALWTRGFAGQHRVRLQRWRSRFIANREETVR